MKLLTPPHDYLPTLRLRRLSDRNMGHNVHKLYAKKSPKLLWRCEICEFIDCWLRWIIKVWTKWTKEPGLNPEQ